ncbi:large conductance mechanosensitive channel protein MscL [Aneurinibacillus uraniidurans]|uniref:large conductance mechanosensitive channel protein MscL n=1 Tax=Aneurinibacillus uraniidurans TaxID=2966586 RepID=UPI00234ABA4C|nr:large conductance mechanosensitive channel protein MscL [Aneurinibacillus sp. B1]WCN39307.1 large conductance mechanosensitive channel protein MscL [Aneurinibacillus sp. B1]
MVKFVEEFRKFISKGNIIDLAVGVALGTAFNKIVTSLVEDILMPPIGKVLGGVDFSALYINLSGTNYASLNAAKNAGAATINYGVFLNNVLHFFIIALTLFIVVRVYSRIGVLRKQEEAVQAPKKKECPYCLSDIPVAAVRCSACTSHLEPVAEKSM